MKPINPYHLAYLVDFIENLKSLDQTQDVDYTLILRRVSKHEGLPIAISVMERVLADVKILESLLGSEPVEESSSALLSKEEGTNN